ncbi:MAG: retroviral-like aspartic protease family protein [Acidobacteriota bacterium]|nr:retroviral-like aspartic protease family protein [Acidobacteriota bacterium]
MSFSFDAQRGLVIVRAELEGPSGSVILRLALDTGATGTMVNVGMLVAVGYDPSLVPERIQVTTGSGVEYVPRIVLSKITALGHERTDSPVLCHTLPPSASVDGLLGLDFLRGQRLTIDFLHGQILLTQ